METELEQQEDVPRGLSFRKTHVQKNIQTCKLKCIRYLTLNSVSL